MRHGKPYRRWGGAQKRVNLLRNLVTGLVRFERIETSIARAHECQKYAERVSYSLLVLTVSQLSITNNLRRYTLVTIGLTLGLKS